MSKFVPSEDCISHFLWRYRYFEPEQKTPKFAYKIVDHFMSATNDDNVRVVRAFRGSSKSTNACYLALHRCELDDAYFTMIVSATATLSEGLIADIKNMIADSDLPYEVVRSVANEIQLRYRGKMYYILGVGSGAALRGTKRGGKRADLILTDDLMTMEVSQNKVRRDRLIRWYYSDLRPSLDPVNGIMWSVGTPMVQSDILDMLANNNPTIDIPLKYGVWKERFPDKYIDKLKDEYKTIGMLGEYKREFELVMVDAENAVFDIKKIKTIDEAMLNNDLTYFCTLDGAFSERDAADYSAFTVLGIDQDGLWYVWSFAMKAAPQDVIGKLFELHSRFGFNEIGIEKGQFLLSMKTEIDKLQVDYQQYFSVKELKTNGSKIARIKALAPVINGGRVTIVDTGKDAELLMEQIELTSNEACVASHDDHLDSMCQLLQMDLYYSEDSNKVPTRAEILEDIHLGMEDDYDDDMSNYGGYALN